MKTNDWVECNNANQLSSSSFKKKEKKNYRVGGMPHQLVYKLQIKVDEISKMLFSNIILEQYNPKTIQTL